MNLPQIETDLLMLADGKIKSTASTIDGSRERFISKDAWREASRQFTRMISVYCSLPNKQELADSWKAHFELIESHPQFSLNFKDLLEYDIRCRLTHLQQAFDPSKWQTEIWREVIENKMLAAARVNRQPSPRPIAYSSRQYEPYSSRPLPQTGRSNYESQNRPRHRSASPPPARMSPCVVCGQRGHRTIDCRPSQSFLVRHGQTWLLPNGKQVCYSWNSSRYGCRGQCPRTHVCSLCGRDHPMLECSSRK